LAYSVIQPQWHITVTTPRALRSNNRSVRRSRSSMEASCESSLFVLTYGRRLEAASDARHRAANLMIKQRGADVSVVALNVPTRCSQPEIRKGISFGVES